ncbi:GAF domain-containing protein [Actinomyces sp. zg-332]|uniref:GAF domain-containing protein n=1 Tax=Actinomyces sp. zg-332 TaxID=2708340 RepID=UPI00142117CC|nr:GAF domain-containing protein [Actinomyces sp. zg-332]QPK93646.1 GAF domain-containing protein [Actinomyces sp. zg-332]
MDHDFQLEQLQEIIQGEDNQVAVMANTSAFLYECIENLNWCGFYIMESENEMVLGPFQGKIACWRIQVGKGVCGYSARNKTSIIVDNVHEFEGHIACDAASMSELVVPIIIRNEVFGVIDIDSYKEKNFTEDDKIFIEKVSEILAEKFS